MESGISHRLQLEDSMICENLVMQNLTGAIFRSHKVIAIVNE